ncbi:MAG: hypothetical protein ACT4PZ_07960 [Panacagrimonas sp.]
MPMARFLRRLAAILMLISGVTHVAQLAVYSAVKHIHIAAMFGVLYFLLGIRLLQPGRAGLWFGATAPCIGGALGLYRFFVLQPNPFSIFHVVIDLVVVPSCIYLLLVRDAGERS